MLQPAPLDDTYRVPAGSVSATVKGPVVGAEPTLRTRIV